jgi:glycosyltransferase involved in cell wall biosynthesis
VLCVRADTAGESNGPLLDAIGAGRASLVTDVGSGPEVAGDGARVVAPTVGAIRAGIEALLDGDERRARAAAALRRAAELTWAASARRHVELLEELGNV